MMSTISDGVEKLQGLGIQAGYVPAGSGESSRLGWWLDWLVVQVTKYRNRRELLPGHDSGIPQRREPVRRA
jgi:hypothetical protein